MRSQLNKPKTLILGSSGLIGNTISKYLAKMGSNLVLGISNKTKSTNIDFLKTISNIIIFDALDAYKINHNLDYIKPDIIINCVGVTKHVLINYDLKDVYFLNSIFPNLLSNWCAKNQKHLIHISSDCIFDGKAPGSRIIDQEAYGYSKYLGERNIDHGFIIRTSTVGRELNSQFGLLDWFLNQDTVINGFTNAFFNGVTTLTLSKYIYKILEKIPNKKTILNLTSERISKFDILHIINSIYECNKTILPFDKPVIDRSLFSYKSERLCFIKKKWRDQILETKHFEQ